MRRTKATRVIIYIGEFEVKGITNIVLNIQGFERFVCDCRPNAVEPPVKIRTLSLKFRLGM